MGVVLAQSYSQTVIAQKTIPAGYASWLEAGNLRVDIPQGAFRTAVSFEILQEKNHILDLTNLEKGQILTNYAFRVRRLSDGKLLVRSEKPIEVGLSLKNVTNFQLWDFELTNPKNLIKDTDFQIINQTLVHQVTDFSLGWLVSAQPIVKATVFASPTEMSKISTKGIFPTNQNFWPILGIICLSVGVLWLINHFRPE